jgi:hypothetical protein
VLVDDFVVAKYQVSTSVMRSKTPAVRRRRREWREIVGVVRHIRQNIGQRIRAISAWTPSTPGR